MLVSMKKYNKLGMQLVELQEEHISSLTEYNVLQAKHLQIQKEFIALMTDVLAVQKQFKEKGIDIKFPEFKKVNGG